MKNKETLVPILLLCINQLETTSTEGDNIKNAMSLTDKVEEEESEVILHMILLHILKYDGCCLKEWIRRI
jgi:hypothetical protein